MNKTNRSSRTDQDWYITAVFILFVIYFLTARVGLMFSPISGFAALVWPPSGIALAALILYGNRLWPGIAIGAFLANYAVGAGIFESLGISVGNTLEAVTGVYLLKKLWGFSNDFKKLRNTIGLIFVGALLAPVISSTIGTLSLLLGRTITPDIYWLTWISWWGGDALSILIYTPLILTWLEKPFFKLNIKERLELFVSLSLIAFMSLIVFRGYIIDTKSLPIIYIIFPPLVWVALRFGVRESTSAILLVNIIGIWGTVGGYGTFARESISDSLYLLKGFIGTSAVTFLILSSVDAEKKLLSSRKDDLLYITSHELKTPLTSLKLYIQLLGEEVRLRKDKVLIQYLKKLDKQSDKLIQLVENILDITKTDFGKAGLKFETFDLRELIKDVVVRMSHVSKYHKLIVKNNPKAIITADRDKISKVITNLLSNAIRFSSKRSKVIIDSKKNNHFVTVSIKDFGIGIQKEDLPQIFDRYYKSSDRAALARRGVGLGLHLSSEILKMHNGSINVTSKIGKGSVFSFKLPLKN